LATLRVSDEYRGRRRCQNLVEMRFLRNYPLQYIIVGTVFVVGGLIALTLGARRGAVALLFGLCGYLFAAIYYCLRPKR